MCEFKDIKNVLESTVESSWSDKIRKKGCFFLCPLYSQICDAKEVIR